MLNKETIIISSNLSSSEKLKSNALFKLNTFNTRYMSTLELARYLLMRSGEVVDKEFIQNDLLAALLYKEVKNIPYYDKFSYNDVLGLLNSINDLRHYIVNDEEDEILNKLPTDKFIEKNDAIKKVYKLLLKTLEDNHLIDEIGIIREAYRLTKTFSDIDFVILSSDKIINQSLDMALISKAGGKDPRKINYNSQAKISSYTKAFSQTNEIEHILDYIYKHNIPFDQCLIAGAETKDYSTILSNYHDLLGFPLTIGVGKNVINTNPGKLFSLVNEFENSHFHTEYLKNIVYDISFNIDLLKQHLQINEDDFEEKNKSLSFPEVLSLDSVITTVGDLRLSFDKDINNQRVNSYRELLSRYQKDNIDVEATTRRIKELDYVIRFKDILNKGLPSFIETYSFNKDDVDNNALNKILKCLSFWKQCDVDYKDIIKVIFNQNVGSKLPEKGTLYFTSIDKASSSLRRHLFIVGLSSSNFPGDNKEDQNLLNRDYSPFGVDNASQRTIENNKNTFISLVKEASELGVDIHLSYAYYNSITLKAQNASSVIFDIYKDENGVDKTIKDLEEEFDKKDQDKYLKVDYFSTDLMSIANIGRTLKDNKLVNYEPYKEEDIKDVSLNKEISLSASSLVTYVECPYQFFLSKVLKLPQPEEIDIFNIIPPNDLGTLAHSLLEDLDKKTTSKEEFLKVASSRFMDYFTIHHNDNVPLINVNKAEFLEMMSNAYDLDDGAETILKEEDLYYKEPKSGLIIHGLPDKVIKGSKGYIAIDYKTGRKVKHKLDDIKSLIQCIVYCYILEKKKHFPMSGFIFRYLRSKTNISSDLPMMDYYKVLEDTLMEIKTSFTTGKFEENVKHCRDCYYKDICRRKK